MPVILNFSNRKAQLLIITNCQQPSGGGRGGPIGNFHQPAIRSLGWPIMDQTTFA